jgi:ASC-1-like (ASCH) protein
MMPVIESINAIPSSYDHEMVKLAGHPPIKVRVRSVRRYVSFRRVLKHRFGIDADDISQDKWREMVEAGLKAGLEGGGS